MNFNPKDYTWIAFKKVEQKMVRIVNSYDPDENEQEWYDFQKFATQHTYATSDNAPEGVELPGEMFGEVTLQRYSHNRHDWVIDKTADIDPEPGTLIRKFLPFIDKTEYSETLEKKPVPIWYDYLSIYNWLRNENWSHKAADEIALKYAENLQGAFAKGWEKAFNDYKKSGTFDYVYYPKTFEAVISSNAEAANKAFDKDIDEAMQVQREIDQAKIEALERLIFTPDELAILQSVMQACSPTNSEQGKIFDKVYLKIGKTQIAHANGSLSLPQPPKTEKEDKG